MESQVPNGERQPIGQTIDALGVGITQADNEIITDVVVICRVIGEDGAEWVRTGWNDGQSWIVRNGLLNSVRMYSDDESRT